MMLSRWATMCCEKHRRGKAFPSKYVRARLGSKPFDPDLHDFSYFAFELPFEHNVDVSAGPGASHIFFFGLPLI